MGLVGGHGSHRCSLLGGDLYIRAVRCISAPDPSFILAAAAGLWMRPSVLVYSCMRSNT